MLKLLCLFLLLVCVKLHAQTVADSTELCFASDTQKPMWVETLFLKKDHNQQATKLLFDAVTKRKPGAFFIMGDVVNLGYSNHQWKPMDVYLKSLRDENVPVYAALGNHEVMGQAGKGMRKFQQRFPDHVPTGYVEVKDSVAVILLNSNFGTLSAEQNTAQIAWYKQTLQKLDADPAIQFIISGCHHSPYTNSKIVGSSKDVQEKFAPCSWPRKKAGFLSAATRTTTNTFKKAEKTFWSLAAAADCTSHCAPARVALMIWRLTTNRNFITSP